MRRSKVVAGVLALIASLSMVVTAVGGGFWKAPPFSSIGIKTVVPIGNDYNLNVPDATVLRVWMETGSPSEACLATMNEANHAPTVQTIYCSSRYVTLADDKEHWGVALTLFVDGPLEDDGSYEDPFFIPAWYSLNVYQEGARFYGPPLRCDLPGC
jgi:hypothetical protein